MLSYHSLASDVLIIMPEHHPNSIIFPTDQLHDRSFIIQKKCGESECGSSACEDDFEEILAGKKQPKRHVDELVVKGEPTYPVRSEPSTKPSREPDLFVHLSPRARKSISNLEECWKELSPPSNEISFKIEEPRKSWANKPKKERSTRERVYNWVFGKSTSIKPF